MGFSACTWRSHASIFQPGWLLSIGSHVDQVWPAHLELPSTQTRMLLAPSPSLLELHCRDGLSFFTSHLYIFENKGFAVYEQHWHLPVGGFGLQGPPLVPGLDMVV